MTNFLITGGAGFIGSHFVIKVADLGHNAVVLDKLTYAANPDNIAAVKHKLIEGDIADFSLVSKILHQEKIDFIVNFAAESHVDNSIKAPENFIQTNIIGTYNLLNCALTHFQNSSNEKKSQFRFLHVSTDEVYGSLAATDPKFNEENPYKPNSPYSASKAASDHLVRAWHETYGLPTITTNCSNNFGAHQHREKFIPTIISSAIAGKNIPLYGNGKNIRDWIFVKDHVDGIYAALTQGRLGETYCFGGKCEKENIELAHEICEILDEIKPRQDGKSYKKQITFITDRLGHDKRYAISNNKVSREFGFKPSKKFSERLRETVMWYLDDKRAIPKK
ncbi:MAG: dTDP-glucose 4,6-dehydratase [Alphaproteobacteria bacterium RIFCSPLOWO2_01_FULL_40_26]|nr:MAG: dTDP-glucose 4,6-dehydratase [Alphaproteobacteria bacterium RIFCSPHIGHO2_02_FULL_40_34]OFW86453.1 MAG: dTDP-glucose 4,6-dehydratase [Alphaproteobacteria bacterium RIFCSPHIGHO2_01_FULL_40_8]OFW94090.1 MAG: dTDP-glucose 4,6-dehydratase [Alphaproteobacteria bacterium RIFCSPLOWO2_01_FULL_40_26]OFX10360.1 MAG: dTDP-glucose 4,6-dehydratase [Alphaproteobacteria bacterium RIFCSPLOWO2_02_FULL_40_19]OFX11149.1 MAG: dTDP-glucose 4,6-dehydratase [Alphaproteobacteria bacterium RIFCSPLOWO2_12_FULL_40